MRIYGNNGVFDRNDNGRIWVQSIETWDDLPDTWEEYTRYVNNPIPTMYYLLPMMDLGSVQTVNILTSLEARGIVNYYIHYSITTDTFIESEANYTSLYIAAGTESIPSITARYVMIQLAIDYDPALGHQYFDSISCSVSGREKTITFENVDSSTLSGSASNRLFTIGTDIGGVKAVQVTNHVNTSPYNVDMYVYHSTTSVKTFPDIISKSTSGVNLQFVGVDGQPRDAIFDITLEVLPQWYIDSTGNLQER